MRPATKESLKPESKLNLGRHVKVTVNYQLNQLRIGSQRLFMSRAWDSRLQVFFNSHWDLRLNYQLQRTERDPDAYQTGGIDPESVSTGAQAVLTYQLTPGTGLFVGYNRNIEREDLLPHEDVQRFGFIKVSYIW